VPPPPVNQASAVTVLVTLIAVVGGIVFMGAAFSLVGGWSELAQKYRSRKRLRGTLFSFATMRLTGGMISVSYRACVFVRLSSEGLSMAVFPLFRLGSPPLFIPWEALHI
jgi:hypothetical protein